MNLVKSPHELLMEQAGLPSYAGGHSVSPEQMKVELMINGRKVHQADLPHDHPLIQHFADGSKVVPMTPRSDYEDLLAHLRNEKGEIKYHQPSTLERVSRAGANFLSNRGMDYDTARQISDTVAGGKKSMLPMEMGVGDALAMGNIIPNPISAAATTFMAPFWVENAGRALAQGQPLDAAMYAAPFAGKLKPFLRPAVKAATTQFVPEVNVPSSYKSVLE
jgi:hypothetical protein